MSKMLTKDQIGRGRRLLLDADPTDDIHRLAGYYLSHIDALTERLEAMADEWEKEANEIHIPVGPYGAGEAMAERDVINAKEEQLRALIEEMKG